MAATSLTNNPLWDSLGCCGVGCLLGGVASFIIYSNTVVLVGKSISEDKKTEISTKLEVRKRKRKGKLVGRVVLFNFIFVKMFRLNSSRGLLTYILVFLALAP